MSFFDNDDFGFEDFFKSLAGGGSFQEVDSDGRKKNSKKYNHVGRIPARQVITSSNIFFIFDFSGEEKISVKIKDDLIKNKYGEKFTTGKKILEIINKSKVIGEYSLPEKLKTAGFNNTFSHGILEVKFKR